MRRDDFTCIDLFAGAGGFSTGARMAVHLLGNAVCPPVARDIINAIRDAA